MLSQTFRSLIHSRLVLGLKSYELAYPNTDIVLFEPDREDSGAGACELISVGALELR